MSNELSTKQERLSSLQIQPSMLEIIGNAVDKGMAPDALSKMWDTYERMEGMTAKKAFASAMAKFSATCPPVQRTTRSDQFTMVRRDGSKGPRMYASLEDISNAVRAPLAAAGLSFRWSDMVVQGGEMKISCIVSHEGGHSESSSVTLPSEVKAGCSEAQKVGIVQTYAMRYSLIQALGLTSCDEDTDGADDNTVECITDDDVLAIEAALSDLNVDRGQFLAYMKCSTIAGIPASKLSVAKAAIEAKRQKIKAGGK